MFQAAAVSGVGTAFALGEQAATVLNVAIGVEAARRQFVKPKSIMRRYDGLSRGERQAKRRKIDIKVTAPVAAASGNYKGQFRKVRRSVRETALTQYGFMREHECYGALKCNDIQYFGVQSINYRQIARPVASALIRMIFYRHFNVTYGSDSDLVFENTSAVPDNPCLRHIYFLCRQKNSTGSYSTQEFYYPSAIGPTTTLGNLIEWLRDALLTQYQFGGYRGYADWHLYGYQFQYAQSNSSATLVQSRSPVYVIQDQNIKLTQTSVIHIQNTTTADDLSADRDNITANPIVGSCFHVKGQFPIVEDRYVIGTADTFSQELQQQNFANLAGLIIPNVNPTNEWDAIPDPRCFANIMSTYAGLRLEPGDIKKDVIKFTFYGKLSELLHGLAINNMSNSVTIEPVRSEGVSLGTCKLFAFEKVVPTGPDAVAINYHIDRYMNCIMDTRYMGNSVRKMFRKLQNNLDLTV